ncbi:MAG: hypothetical protein ACTS7E_03995 [Arsenophonus sp. NC-CH8-MAG3]
MGVRGTPSLSSITIDGDKMMDAAKIPKVWSGEVIITWERFRIQSIIKGFGGGINVQKKHLFYHESKIER